MTIGSCNGMLFAGVALCPPAPDVAQNVVNLGGGAAGQNASAIERDGGSRLRAIHKYSEKVQRAHRCFAGISITS